MADIFTNTNYREDRDIPDNVWGAYLKKYENTYQLKTDADGFWCIRCSRGRVGLYSMIHSQLFFSTLELTKKQTTWFLKNLRKEHEKNVVVTQARDYEFTVCFKEDYLPLLAVDIGVLKKMNLSDAERERRSKQMKINSVKAVKHI